jgi:hypothetical protein
MTIEWLLEANERHHITVKLTNHNATVGDIAIELTSVAERTSRREVGDALIEHLDGALVRRHRKSRPDCHDDHPAPAARFSEPRF